MGSNNSRGKQVHAVRPPLPADHSIERFALDPSGVLGSLYDATKDHLLPCSPLHLSNKRPRSHRKLPPIVAQPGSFQAKEFLKTVGIDREQHLSHYLNVHPSDEKTILRNYPFPANAYTRLFFIHHKTRHNYFPLRELDEESKGNATILAANPTATHVITEVEYGLHIVVVMQITSENSSAIDEFLDRLEGRVVKKILTVKAREKPLCDAMTDVKVFSNIAELNQLTSLTEICQKIAQIQSNTAPHPPIKYTLHPLQLLCPWLPSDKRTYVPFDPALTEQIESHLPELSMARGRLQQPLSPSIEQAVLTHLKQSYESVQQRAARVEEAYPRRVQRLRNVVLAIRGGRARANELREPVIDKEDTGMIRECHEIVKQRQMLVEKAQFIEELKEHNIEYWNVKDFVKNDTADIEVLEDELINKRKGKRIFCFDDTLKRQLLNEWNGWHQELLNGKKTNYLVYADFSSCKTRPAEFKIISFSETIGPRLSTWDESTPYGRASARRNLRLDLHVPSSNTSINILLLGEIGVGKSTFINALLNYLKYETLDRACADKPLTFLPVSFPFTAGDLYEENVIRFGGMNPNEDHRTAGQSVTQQCRSYVLPISTQVNIRLIDTPGMGDKRGFAQDDLAMQNILSFVNNLAHINAVCIVVKPNESRPNILFRSYFTRLLAFFGEPIRKNIVFCFTHTRATFFAPGNAAGLIRKMLQANAMTNIPLKKTNTFCFDSEGFRYLIARQNGLPFNNYQKDEYRKSWETSVKESSHLLYYIGKDLQPLEQKDWQSVEHAQWQINKLVRPLLEALVNHMRNMILIDKMSANTLIKLSPSAVQRNFFFCTHCDRVPIVVENFRIIPDDLHLFADRCSTCQCTFAQHTKVNYVLKYEAYAEQRQFSVSDLRVNIDVHKQWAFGLLDFFRSIARVSKENDPILVNLQRMIDEEKNIVERSEANIPNSHLYEELNTFKDEYVRTWTTARNSTTLSDIYKLVKIIARDSIIGAQLEAVKQTQQMYMHEQERRCT